ncbi:MAG: 16S rRNA (cytosine(1402)-N(4))-methyltransferase RsmH [Succinivibrio sp.]|nr:16S rRNA (cytosine(1402)-N(4))-methyltransferase RsmH [Succinivibrio sp.]
MPFSHIPVLLNEVLEQLEIKADGIYIDGTFGRGGHSREILKRLGETGRLYALDRDEEAVKAAAQIDDPRFGIKRLAFSKLEEFCQEQGIVGRVDGILLDIGVSSPQLDDASRGFSFDRDGPLDMRMDTRYEPSAATVVNTYDHKTLTRIFRDYGEERFASKVASAIIREREKKPFCSTLELSRVISSSIPGANVPKNKATRCFQALRIAVNSELDELSEALEGAVRVLRENGRLCVISFHSLEDRIVKNFIKEKSRGREIPAGVPLTFSQTEEIRLATATMEPVAGPIKASSEEVARNIRSRSATLRVAKRLKRM